LRGLDMYFNHSDGRDKCFHATIGLNETGGFNGAYYRGWTQVNAINSYDDVSISNPIARLGDSGPGRRVAENITFFAHVGVVDFLLLPGITPVGAAPDYIHGPYKRAKANSLADLIVAQAVGGGVFDGLQTAWFSTIVNAGRHDGFTRTEKIRALCSTGASPSPALFSFVPTII
jgi:hypothetical protein